MTNYKAHERRTAAALGGKRNVDGKGDHAIDVTHELFATECKTRRTLPAWLIKGMQQARRSAGTNQLPIVVIHQHGARYGDDLVILRMADFRDYFGDVCTPPVEVE